MEGEEYINDSFDNFEQESEEIRRKPNVSTQKSREILKFSENSHIADLQQRVIRLEYELFMIRDKLFEQGVNKSQPKLSPYGKVVKRRLTNGQH